MSDQTKNTLPGLSELLTSDSIVTNYQAKDWKDAVRKAGELLHQSGAVREEYIEAMVETCLDLGPYIVIAKGIALPHAAPDKGALQTALSMVTLSPPVEFGNKDNDPVRLVIGLAAVDHEVHIEALRALAGIFIDQEMRGDLMNADSVTEILSIICRAEKKMK